MSCAKCLDRQKITRQIRVHKLEDMFFSVKVSEPVQPQVEQRGPLGLHLIGQRCCRLRQEDLSSMRGGEQPGNAVQGRTEVVAIPLFGASGVQRATDNDRSVIPDLI